MPESPPRQGLLAESPAPRGLAAPRQTRRLSDKILVAFHQACDQHDLEIAALLLEILERMVVRRPVNPDLQRRRNIEGLIAAHERLWHLRHPALPE
jgi:hypothetical protein